MLFINDDRAQDVDIRHGGGGRQSNWRVDRASERRVGHEAMPVRPAAKDPSNTAMDKGLRPATRICRSVSEVELDALCEGDLPPPVNGARLAAHVGLPGIGARLPSAAGLLLAPECAADFRS